MITSLYIFRSIESGNIIVFPGSKNEQGFPSVVDSSIKVAPGAPADLGAAIRRAVEISEQLPRIQQPAEDVLKRELGYSLNSRKIAKLFRYCYVMSNPGPEDINPARTIASGYTIRLMLWRKSGFTSIRTDPKIHLSGDCTNEDLGRGVLRMFDTIEEMVSKNVD